MIFHPSMKKNNYEFCYDQEFEISKVYIIRFKRYKNLLHVWNVNFHKEELLLKNMWGLTLTLYCVYLFEPPPPLPSFNMSGYVIVRLNGELLAVRPCSNIKQCSVAGKIYKYTTEVKIFACFKFYLFFIYVVCLICKIPLKIEGSVYWLPWVS